MKVTDFFKTQAKWILMMASASIVGGMSTAVVLAAIPDSGGTIHGCYNNNTGGLSVVDTDAGQSCSSKQTSLNWSAGGSGGGGMGLKGYALVHYDQNTGAYSVDPAHSSSNVVISNPQVGCLSLTSGVPVSASISLGTGASTSQPPSVAVRDSNGWAGGDGSECDSSAPGSNVAAGSIGAAFFVQIY